MAIKSSQINVTDLDFEDIGDNLKAYLQGQDKLKDYNFEGSTMSVLIDLLAYASHIGAVNTNIAGSELFLDSAQIRKNVVSRAKDLGFVPATESCTGAIVDIAIRNVRNADGSYPTVGEMQLERGQIFETVFDGITYEFVVPNTVKPTQNTSTYNYANVPLIQGTYATDQFIFDSQVGNPKFVLSNSRVDKSKLQVSINSGGVSTAYTQALDVSNIKTTSQVYYTQENEEGFVEIYFGDGTLGVALKDGDVITGTYIIVDTVHCNGASKFTQVSSVNGYTDSTITTTSNAAGGAEKEDIESIKFKATKFYTSQNRLVTLNDYKAKVKEYYPNADAVAVWGGEDNDPPQYGKVFLAIKPLNSDYLSTSEKTAIKSKLNSLNMLTVRPEIVDAEIVNILLSTTFKYNERATTLSQGELETVVQNAINSYDTKNLTNFDAVFRHSNLVKSIDESNSAILSNTTNVRLRKKIETKPGQLVGYLNNFGNTFYNPTSGYNAGSGGITVTTGFYSLGDATNIHYFDDDGKGNLREYYLSGSTRIYVNSTAGTVNYSTGLITINAINITSTVNVDSTIDFTMIPNGNDVVATRGILVDISTADVKVIGEIDTIASGESSAGVGFTSTSSSSY
jgi:hypothetical protein